MPCPSHGVLGTASVDLESTPEPTSPVGKPVLHMQHTCSGEPVAQSPDALARPASNNMPLSKHDTQELRRLLYLRAEGIERQERLQYLGPGNPPSGLRTMIHTRYLHLRYP